LNAIPLGIARIETARTVAMRARPGVELHAARLEVRGPRIDVLGLRHQHPDVIEPRVVRISDLTAGVEREVVRAARHVELTLARPPFLRVSEHVALERLHARKVAHTERDVANPFRRRAQGPDSHDTSLYHDTEITPVLRAFTIECGSDRRSPFIMRLRFCFSG